MSEKEIVAMTKCFFCGGDKNIIMSQNLKDISHLHKKVIDDEPCEKCKEYMEKGIILISCKDDDRDYRTGGFVVIKEPAIHAMFEKSTAREVLKHRAAFIGDSMWDSMGLPREEINNEEETTKGEMNNEETK